MSEIGVFEAMRTCRTVRRFRPDPVPDALLRRVLEAATWAPSGGNRQPWRFVVLKDREKRRRLRDLYLPTWRGYVDAMLARGASLPEETRRRNAKALEGATWMAEHLDEAPVLVVVCVRPKDLMITDAALDRPSVVGGASIYPAVQNLLLACRAVGLGAALTTLLCVEEPEIRKLLAIPDDWATAAHVPIGFPEGRGYGPLPRRDVGRVAFLDGWDRPLWPAGAGG